MCFNVVSVHEAADAVQTVSTRMDKA